MTKKRILSALLAGLMTLASASALSSCAKKEAEPPKQKRTNVYSAVDCPMNEGISYINQMMAAENDVYFLYNKEYTITFNDLGEEVERTEGYDYAKFETEEAELPEGWWYGYDSQQCMGRYNVDTGDMTEVPMETNTENGGYLSSVCLTPSGKMLGLMQEWVYNEDYSESTTTYLLYTFDSATGDVTEKITLNDGMVKAGLDPNNVYLNQMMTDANGNLYFSAESSILTFSEQGEFQKQVEVGDGWISNLINLGDSMLVMWYPNMGGGNQCKILKDGVLTDTQSESLKELVNGYYGCVGFSGGKVYLNGNGGISTYDPAADELKEELNFINSDIDDSDLGSLVVLADGRIVMASTVWEENTNTTTLSVLTRVPDEQLTEEIIVTIGCLYEDYYLKKSIIRYNKQNTGIRITLRNYGIYNNEENEWEGAKTQLNNDIISGNVPDMVLLDSSLPIQSYFHKGIFADLTPFMDGENGIDRSLYLPNLFELSTVNGKLYSLILSFSLNTLTAKSEFVGKEPGWTFDEMMACIQSMPEGMEAFWGESRDNIINYFFTYAMSSFVDWNTGETKFESQGFIDFIKYLSTCSEKSFWDDYYGGDMVWDEYDEDQYRELDELYAMRYYQNRSLFEFSSYMSSFTDLLYTRNNFATKEITAIGYPTDVEGANGAAIVPGVELGISQKSPVKDQAWEILRFFLNDEKFEKDTYQFLPRLSALENKAAAAGEDYYDYFTMTDDDYNWYLEMGYSQDYVDYMKNSRQSFEQSVVDETLELIRGAKSIVRSDDAMLDIIKEELSGFFAGTKSAEDTARVIGSRVKIYVSENS